MSALARRDGLPDGALAMALPFGRRALCCVSGDAGTRPPPPAPVPRTEAAARLTPCQRAAYNSLTRAACAGYVPAVELRGSSGVGRGQGVTTILRALCDKLAVSLIGAAAAFDEATVFETVRALLAGGVEVVVVDDLELLAPEAPRRLLTALADLCAAKGACLVYASGGERVPSSNLVVTIPTPAADDYACLLANIGRAEDVDTIALFAARPGLAPASLRNLAARAQIRHAAAEANGTLHLQPATMHDLLLALADAQPASQPAAA